MSRWSSRKLAICIGSCLMATLLLVAGFIDQAVWQFVFTGTIGVYLASQAGVDIMEARGNS